MLLNDHMDAIAQSPLSFTWGLCHPPHSDRDIEIKSWLEQVKLVAKDNGENWPGFQNGIQVIPTFHADFEHWFYAGRNTLAPLQFHKFGTAKVKTKQGTKTEKTVTLILPDWWHR